MLNTFQRTVSVVEFYVLKMGSSVGVTSPLSTNRSYLSLLSGFNTIYFHRLQSVSNYQVVDLSTEYLKCTCNTKTQYQRVYQCFADVSTVLLVDGGHFTPSL